MKKTTIFQKTIEKKNVELRLTYTIDFPMVITHIVIYIDEKCEIDKEFFSNIRMCKEGVNGYIGRQNFDYDKEKFLISFKKDIIQVMNTINLRKLKEYVSSHMYNGGILQ